MIKIYLSEKPAVLETGETSEKSYRSLLQLNDAEAQYYVF